jgi:branched-chain amino acid transport system ATP-binding protein
MTPDRDLKDQPLLTVRDLYVAYGQIEAVKGVSLEVPAGQVTCLLGPNGAGKTTTLFTLAGILRPRRGRIEFMGRDMTGAPPERIVGAGIVLVPENRLLFPEMTVLENLMAGAYLRKGQVQEDLDWVMELFPVLKARLRQLAGTLSGGEQQMLAIARALMARPRLLMLDEPSLGLAPLIIEEIYHALRRLSSGGTTILLVEQTLHLARELGHRFYVMVTGRIVYEGGRAELAQEDVIRRAYLGAPSGQ